MKFAPPPIAHEIVHSWQYSQAGVPGFVSVYLAEILINGYENSMPEDHAYKFSKAVLNDLNKRFPGGLIVNVKISLVLLLFVVVSGCDALLQVKGVVRDHYGQPVLGAKVWLINGDRVSQGVTNSEGKFSIGEIHGGKKYFVLLVAKKGKKTYFKAISEATKLAEINAILYDGDCDVLDVPLAGH